jgi:PAS domain S-box-containing protein
MQSMTSTSSADSSLRWFVAVLGMFAVISGATTLVGWFAAIPRLTDWIDSGISMLPNAAVGVVCSGAAVTLATLDRRWSTRVGALLGAGVALLGVAALFQHVSGIALGIDTLLFEPAWGTKAAVAPGRIGPPASTSFTILGLGLLFMASGKSSLRRMVPALGIAVASIAALSLMGYFSGADPLFAVARYTGIAMQTASALLALGLAVAGSVPEREPLRTIRGNSAASLLARRSLPFIIAVPLVLGLLRIRGQEAGLFDTAMGTSLLMLLVVLIFSGLLWWWVGTVAKHERELRESEARMSGLVSSAMDAVIAVDGRQRVVLFNPAAEKIFAVAASDALRSSLDRFIPARFREEHRRHVEKFSETGVTNRRMGALGALTGLRANGDEFPIEASISQMGSGEDKVFTVILRDITERKRAEDALRDAHAQLANHAVHLETLVEQRTAKLNETVGDLETFSYSIVHDLRAPLRAMNNFARLLADECGPISETANDYIRRITTAAERMDRLIQEVLNYGRIARAEVSLAPVDAGALLRGMLDTYPTFQPPHADVELTGNIPRVLANEAALTQCLSNLLDNAVKFVSPGVTPRVRVWAEPSDLRVRLFFQDNAIGIEKEAHEKIFEMFQRLSKRYDGTGVGLTIVKKAIEKMGGKVGLESEPGKGSTFWIELLAATAKAVPPESTNAGRPNDNRTHAAIAPALSDGA